MMKTVKIGNRIIGGDNPTFVIAELSCNHLQKYELAVETINSLKDSGVDAIKLSTDNHNGGITIDCANKYFQIEAGTQWDGRSLYNLYEETYTPWEWHADLKKLIESMGMIFFSTPSCKPGVDFLESLNVPCYKIASFEITDIPLIEYIASKGRPVIISTGIATLDEINEAMAACRKMNNYDVILLKCTSSYPASLDEMNLATITDLQTRFDIPIGLSDHSLGDMAPIVAVSLGAKVVEKHLILSRELGGPDATFSIEPAEFKTMVSKIRDVEKALGIVNYDLSEKIKNSRKFARSLFVVEDVENGEIVSEKNVRSIRPNDGMSPREYNRVLGLTFKGSYKKGTPLNIEMLG